MRRIGGWIPAAVWALLAILAGCLENPAGHESCGNSAGCGNPTKLTELQTSETTCPGSQCGGFLGATAISIRIGDSLRIELDSENFIEADSVQKTVLLYQGFQVPVFSPDPIDSIPMKGNTLVLHSVDLARARAAVPAADTGTFAFSIRVMLRIYSNNQFWTQENLLAGLGLETDSNRFILSPRNPLQDTVKPPYLQDTVAAYQGLIRNWRSLSTDAESAFVYIPGSPYHDVISITDGRFILAALPYGQLFELRFFVVPRSLPSNRKVPTYVLTSKPDISPDRVFDAIKTSDSLSIPIP